MPRHLVAQSLLSTHSHPDMPSSPLRIRCSILHIRARGCGAFDAKPLALWVIHCLPLTFNLSSGIEREPWHVHTCLGDCLLSNYIQVKQLLLLPQESATGQARSSQTCRVGIFGRILEDVPLSLLQVSGKKSQP